MMSAKWWNPQDENNEKNGYQQENSSLKIMRNGQVTIFYAY